MQPWHFGMDTQAVSKNIWRVCKQYFYFIKHSSFRVMWHKTKAGLSSAVNVHKTVEAQVVWLQEHRGFFCCHQCNGKERKNQWDPGLLKVLVLISLPFHSRKFLDSLGLQLCRLIPVSPAGFFGQEGPGDVLGYSTVPGPFPYFSTFSSQSLCPYFSVVSR